MIAAVRCISIGLFVSIAFTFLGCDRSDNRNSPGAAPAAIPEVTVSKALSKEITDYFEFPGQTAAVGDVEIRARVTGYLIKVNFKDGQNVTQGQLLYEIDPRPYEAALERAKGELVRLQALAEKAKADLARSKRLRPSGAVSEDEYELHIANLKVQTASIQSAEAAVRDAELNLEFTKITSPIDGRISRTRVTEGNLIQVGGGEGSLLTTVVTTKPIYAYFDVDEQAFLEYENTTGSLSPDEKHSKPIPVEIGLMKETGFPHKGVLDFADNKLNRNTGTLRVRGVFENTDERLTPGLFVHVRIPFGVPHNALLVSERAVGTDQEQKYLLVVNKDNTVEYRRVKVGALCDGMQVIESGLTPDDLVVVNGLQRARPGAKVQPVLAKEEAAAQVSMKKMTDAANSQQAN
jgi:RND family efflux transporter MFP subunit